MSQKEAREFDKKRIHEMYQQIEPAKNEHMNDTVNRQAVVDAANKNRDTVFHNYVDYEGILYDISNLPSAQPEIIRCKDCKYAEVADPEDSQDGYTCQFHRGSIWFSGSYCSWAERKEGCE